jgi:cytochrome c oxidase cbb3-type subunit 3
MNNQEKDQDKVLDHNYDGIEEFDNPLPRWWLMTFYGAIVFSFFYVAHYHFGPGWSPEQELAAGLEKVQQAELASQKEDPPPTEEYLLALLAPAKKEEAKKIFLEKCASCHADDGGGQIGPNLTDKFWINGEGKILEILKVVSDGVPEKGMPPWKSMLKKEDLQLAVAYVHSLKGVKPKNPKEPQGAEAKN